MNITQLKRKFLTQFEHEVRELAAKREGPIAVRISTDLYHLPTGMGTLMYCFGSEYPSTALNNLFLAKYVRLGAAWHERNNMPKLKKYHPDVYKILNYYGPLLPLHSAITSPHISVFNVFINETEYASYCFKSIEQYTRILEERAKSNFSMKNIDVAATMRLLDEYKALYPNLLNLPALE